LVIVRATLPKWYKLNLLNNMTKNIERKTHKLDAAGKPLGRLATDIAVLLQGKHKPEYEPEIDMGDFVHVLNIDKVKLSGKKPEQKIYYRHSGYPGGLKETVLKQLLEKGEFDKVLKLSVDKMLPKNKFRTPRLKRITFGNTK